MLTITDIRALSGVRFDNKYEKLAMIVGGIFIAWMIVALICQTFAISDKIFTYSIPQSAIRESGNSLTISYGFDKISINDYIIDSSREDMKKGNTIFMILGIGFPFVVLMVLMAIYYYKRERYKMIFQQKWLETGIVPDTDKI